MRPIKVTEREAELVYQFRRMGWVNGEMIVRLCTRMAARTKSEIDAWVAFAASQDEGVK